jgi:hypothetical protein
VPETIIDAYGALGDFLKMDNETNWEADIVILHQLFYMAEN